MAARTAYGIDVHRVEAAIKSAERCTSGELRVAIARFYFWGDVRRAAEATFARLRMHRTARRNAVLIFVAPRRRRFAIVADEGIHGHVTAAFWNDVSGALRESFHRGERTSGLERAIAAIGERLSEHFPPEATHSNELSDRVAF
jgi:uncharacterized membrane protein